MVKIKPFCGIRPPKQYAAEVASRPYDVLNSVEAKAEATERSLLHIIKPEIDFDPIADEHSEEVYQKAMDNFARWQQEGWLVQDPEEYYYVYAQTMDGRTQYGLAMCCHYEDYRSGAIKKHELTRPDKEEDRMIHVRNQQANIEPVFFAYPDDEEINAIVAEVIKGEPEYDSLILTIFGFCVCYWYMLKSKITQNAFWYMIPAVLSLAGMSVATKEIATMGQDVWANILYYLVVSTFVSGVYNYVFLCRYKHYNFALIGKMIFNYEVVKVGVYIVSFSAALIAAKTMAMRLAPNPGYVVTLLLTAPIFVYLLEGNKKASSISEKAGFAMLFFLFLIMMLLVNNFNIND